MTRLFIEISIDDESIDKRLRTDPKLKELYFDLDVPQYIPDLHKPIWGVLFYNEYKQTTCITDKIEDILNALDVNKDDYFVFELGITVVYVSKKTLEKKDCVFIEVDSFVAQEYLENFGRSYHEVDQTDPKVISDILATKADLFIKVTEKAYWPLISTYFREYARRINRNIWISFNRSDDEWQFPDPEALYIRFGASSDDQEGSPRRSSNYMNAGVWFDGTTHNPSIAAVTIDVPQGFPVIEIASKREIFVLSDFFQKINVNYLEKVLEKIIERITSFFDDLGEGDIEEFIVAQRKRILEGSRDSFIKILSERRERLDNKDSKYLRELSRRISDLSSSLAKLRINIDILARKEIFLREEMEINKGILVKNIESLSDEDEIDTILLRETSGGNVCIKITTNNLITYPLPDGNSRDIGIWEISIFPTTPAYSIRAIRSDGLTMEDHPLFNNVVSNIVFFEMEETLLELIHSLEIRDAVVMIIESLKSINGSSAGSDKINNWPIAKGGE